MAELVIAGPGKLETPTGGYRYDARVLKDVSARGHEASWLALPEDFPFPSAASMEAALAALKGVPHDATLVIDGLAYGALPVEGIAALARPVVALIHHPLALELGLAPDAAASLAASERDALAAAALIVTTSEATRRVLVERFGAAEHKVRVAEPGVDPAAPTKGGGETPVVLTVGAVVPRKNHLGLARALAGLRDVPWRWRIAGSLTRDLDCATALADEIARSGIEDRVETLGALDDDGLEAAYLAADLFALPSYLEGYGMASAEALARGLPVIAGRDEAAAALIGETAGALVDPDDFEAIAAALRRFLTEPAALRRASNAARLRAARLPRWFQCADVFEHLITRPLPK
ncbi:glycosyltransferase family 4 protein [Hansschlegelia zhihuaiae]|uniref:glycosyltransferase family 4 protein n=1 Tax=Hansschlegelia zhihuaiae TaxID=405005 RepID=UPI0013E8BE53|nr:glycosyltransferase family 4 protein [Hansschlegelia zhihuaiae]